MGILTAILSVVSAIFGAICSAVAAIVKVTPWWVWVGAGLVLVGVWLGYRSSGGIGMPGGCSCRELMCGKRTPRPPRPPRTYTITGTVGDVIDANLFTMYVTPRRVRTVTIAYVVIAPVPVTIDKDYGPMVDTRDLEPLYLTQKLLPKGKPVSVLCEGRRIFGTEDSSSAAPDGQRRLESEEVESEQTTAETTDSQGPDLEGKGPIVGVVTGPTGADVGLELIKVGYATCATDAPESYKAAEKVAKKRGKK